MDAGILRNWLPAEVQGLFDRVGYRWTDEGNPRAQGAIALVGLDGAGKKTLYNSLRGWQAVADSGETIRSFGLFTLVDLSDDQSSASSVLYKLESARLIVYIVNARNGLDSNDYEWIAQLRALNATLLVALNVTDQLSDGDIASAAASIQEKVTRPVLPLVASDVEAVHRQFLPAVLKLCPDLAEYLASEIAGLRRQVAYGVIARCAAASAASLLDSRGDVTTLAALQAQMIRRVAAVYGHRANASYEVIVMPLLRQSLWWTKRLVVRFPKLRPWMVSGAVAVLGTVIIGQMAILLYGGKLSVGLLEHLPARHRHGQSAA